MRKRQLLVARGWLVMEQEGMMSKKTAKTGKELERRVADAYREMGAWKVEHDVELAGSQIDVYVELETPGRLLHRIAVEVKDWSKPIGIDVVSGFAVIVNLLRSERLIDEGVIVSASGFSKQARNAANIYDIHLLELADLDRMVEEAISAWRARSTAPAVPSLLTQAQALEEVGGETAKRKAIPKAVRDKLLVEAMHRCCLCPEHHDITDLHHIVPISEDGPNTEDNLMVICPTCHAKIHRFRSSYTLDQLRMYKERWVQLCALGLPLDVRLAQAFDYTRAPPQGLAGVVERDTEFAYDVFISYSHKDGEWVYGWLLPRLEDAGLRVCIDFRDFDIGVPSLVNMERAMENSHRTLLVLTPAWVESAWTDFEVLLTQTTDPAGRRRRLLPILLQPCQLPHRIAMLTRADFTRPDNWDTQLQRVIAAVRGELRLPEVSPPLKQATLIRIMATGKFYLGEDDKARYIPDNPTLRAVKKSSGAKGVFDLNSSKELYEQYTVGDDLPSQAPQIFQDSQGVKYLVAREERRRIPNDETLKALGGDPRHVRTKSDEYLARFREGSPLPEHLGVQWSTSEAWLVKLATEYTAIFLVRGPICRWISTPAYHEKLRKKLQMIGPEEPIDEQELERYVEGISIESERDVRTALEDP